MQCPSCGHQNRADARFCDTCGAPLSQRGQAAAAPANAHFNTQNAGPGGAGWQSATTMNQPLPVSLPQQSVASMPLSAAPTPSTQPEGHGGNVGWARNVQRSQEQTGSQQAGTQRTVQVLRFALEQFDGSGNRPRVRSVEMRGRSIVGFISEGDEVEVFGKEEDGLIHAKQIQNLTTVAAVKAKGIPTAIKVFTAIGIVIFVLFMTFIVLLILGVFQIGPH